MTESTHIPGKRCTKCGVAKPLTEFTRTSRKGRGGKIYYRGPCRACQSDYLREFSRERREFLQQYRSDRGCIDCGYNETYMALEFDHRPDEVKLFEPSALRFSGTWQQMLDELAKCDVVCSNCHRIRTFTRNDSARNRKWDLRRDDPVAPLSHIDIDPDQLDLFDIA